MALSKQGRATCLQHADWEQEHHLFDPASAGNVHEDDSEFSLLCTCSQMAMKALWILLWSLQMHFSEQANSQMESSDENELYLLS